MPLTPESERFGSGAPLDPESRRERLLRIGSSATVRTTAEATDNTREFGDDEEPLNASVLTEYTSLNGNDLGRSYGTLPSPTRSDRKSVV